jgi:hypothetical protein
MRFPTNNPAGTGQPNTTAARLSTADHPTAPGRAGDQGCGGHSAGETPGPIPNPEAKTRSADGTAPGRVWESRTPPHHTTGTGPANDGGARTPLTTPPHPATDPDPADRTAFARLEG